MYVYHAVYYTVFPDNENVDFNRENMWQLLEIKGVQFLSFL